MVNDDIEVDIDFEYTVNVTDATIPDYKVTSGILTWLHDNLSSLAVPVTDDSVTEDDVDDSDGDDQEPSTTEEDNQETTTDEPTDYVFSKVNTGFNETTLKTFGKKPVCDVYINNLDYDTDFDFTRPVIAHTIVLAYIKGANNYTYNKACELHDYLMQQFIEDKTFRELEDIVKDTYIKNSEIRPQPIGKKWGVMVALELTHNLY